MAFQLGITIAFNWISLFLGTVNEDWKFSLFGTPVYLGITNLLAVLCVIDIERRWRGSPWANIPNPISPTRRTALPALLASAGLVMVILFLMGISYPWMLEMGYEEGPLEDLLNPLVFPIGAPFLAVIVAPLTEEFVCRYMVLGGLLRTIRPKAAILLSAVLFSALHLNLWQVPSTLLVGLLIGWAYYRTRSLGLCMAMHSVHNGIVIGLIPLGAMLHSEVDLASNDIPDWLVGYPLVGVGAIPLSAGLWLLQRRTLQPTDRIVEREPQWPPTPPPLPPTVPTDQVSSFHPPEI